MSLAFEVYDLANPENSQQELPNPCRRIVTSLPKHKKPSRLYFV